MVWLPDGEKSFDTISAYDGLTDRQMDRQTDIQTSCDSTVCAIAYLCPYIGIKIKLTHTHCDVRLLRTPKLIE